MIHVRMEGYTLNSTLRKASPACVQLAIQETSARMTLMNVWTSHVRMEGPVLTPREASPAHAQLATWETSARMTLMNVRISHVSTYILKVSHGYKSNIVQYGRLLIVFH